MKGECTMKKQWKIFGAMGLTLALLAGSVPAYAAHPQGYWPYLSAFTEAKNANNKDQMLVKGNALLQYYQNLPLDADVASIRYNVNYANYPIYESKGNYAKAKEALQQVEVNGAYLGFTDAVTMAKERERKIDPMTQVYALTNGQAPYYGAKNEPKSGTWYGRVWTEANNAAAEGESIVSFYVELGQSTADELDRYISPFDDGKHAIHIAWNFPQEGSTVSAINAGTYDANIQKTLSYLATLKSPVLLRIGGEMNVWTNATTGEAFKAAYTRIAQKARSIAPNVALVFSPNYTSSFGGSMETYFPNASLVDWIGASLYTNKYQSAFSPQAGQDANEMYFGIGNYADPVKSFSHAADLAKKYNKPMIVTEGGSGHSISGSASLSDFAAERVKEMYTTLNMVYPQVKAIIYFDRNGSGYDYTLQNNASVQAAYVSALKSNPTLISQVGQQAQTFQPLSSVTGVCGVVTLRAYCDVIGQTVTATYSVDGKWLGTQTSMPYRCQLDTSTLTVGTHTMKVIFQAPNGFSQTLNYQLTKAANGSVSFKQA